jgi:CBS domain-containing protein
LTDKPGAPLEVSRFLQAHPPFDALDLHTVERVAAAAEVEFFRAGTTIFSPGAEPVDHLRVVRSGAVEIVHHGQVLDLLGEGEMFGHASMLSGLPTGFEPRAAEDTLWYRIPAEVAHEPLAAPVGRGLSRARYWRPRPRPQAGRASRSATRRTSPSGR